MKADIVWNDGKIPKALKVFDRTAYEYKPPVCRGCGRVLDKDAIEADRDICFECYCYEQD